MKFKTILIDDEPYARKELIHQLDTFDCFDVVGECGNAVEGMKAIKVDQPDIVFLDIQMPGLSGFDMLSLLEDDQLPYIIFVTAYDEYAIQAFEEKALDYLLKPIDPKRFEQTVKRIQETVRNGTVVDYDIKPLTKIPCCLNQVIKLLDISDVCYVVSDVTGVHVVNQAEQLLTDLTMKVLEQRTNLFRCHRQYLINLDKIDEIRLLENGGADAVTGNDQIVPISRRNLKELKQLIGMK